MDKRINRSADEEGSMNLYEEFSRSTSLMTIRPLQDGTERVADYVMDVIETLLGGWRSQVGPRSEIAETGETQTGP